MTRRPIPHMLLRGALCAVIAATMLAPAAAQDFSKGLNILNSVLGAKSTSPANVVTNALAPSSGGKPDVMELVKLLAQSMENIDEPKEIEIGRNMAAVLLGSKPLHPDMKLQRYVNQLGRWISLQSSRPHLAWQFAVIDDPGFNAFAAPGGYVLVTKGLVDRVDEAELAGILAHEITHVTEKHHLNALRVRARAGLVGMSAQALLARQGAAADALGGALTGMVRDVYSKGLDRDDEFSADVGGVTMAARSGFDPYGLPSVLLQLRSVPADDGLFALQMSTHPPAQQRLDYLESAMGNRLDGYAGKPSVSVAQRLRQVR